MENSKRPLRKHLKGLFLDAAYQDMLRLGASLSPLSCVERRYFVPVDDMEEG